MHQRSSWFVIGLSILRHQVMIIGAQNSSRTSMSSAEKAVFANATRFPLWPLTNWRYDADATWRVTGADESGRAWLFRWTRSRLTSGTGSTRLVTLKIVSIDAFRAKCRILFFNDTPANLTKLSYQKSSVL